jgi:hypothetical protein
MKARSIMLVAAIAVMLVAAPASASNSGARPKTCTWAGTPAAPTGTFTITPGVTNVPSAEPLEFRATGVLAGGPGCTGTMTWVGQFDAGSSCAAILVEGVVKGLPGVARFVGKGNLLAPSLLYDRSGNLVGVENAEILTPANQPHFADCSTPRGFTGGWPGMFSSVFTLK